MSTEEFLIKDHYDQSVIDGIIGGLEPHRQLPSTPGYYSLLILKALRDEAVVGRNSFRGVLTAKLGQVFNPDAYEQSFTNLRESLHPIIAQKREA